MKTFYKRKRFWFLAALIVAVYFCLIPSRLRVSPETTLITSPLKADGTPDYFKVWSEKTWLPKLSPPEDNGQRLMIAACGPRVLEQIAIVNEVPWEEMSTHKDSKRWFAEYWTPMCEAMGIDPLAKPPYLKNISITSQFSKKWESLKDKPEEAKEWKYDAYHKRFAETLWKTADHPEIAGWLAERKPVLDLFGVAVRKPHFEGWRKGQNGNGGMISILLPDVQANRDFARDLEIRAAAKAGDGDIDGALYDVMSMYRFAGHFRSADFFVTKLVGLAAEETANKSLMLILKSGKVTKEQLSRFSAELKTLPSHWEAKSVQSLCEEYLSLDTITTLSQMSVWDQDYWGTLVNSGLGEGSPFTMTRSVFYRVLFSLPFDVNIAGRRIIENRKRIPVFLTDWQSSPFLWLKFGKESEERWNNSNDDVFFHRYTYRNGNFNMSAFFALPLIRTRSQFIGDMTEAVFSPAINAFIVAMVRGGTQTELMQLAIQLECYKLDTGKYPDSLDQLAPKYIDEIPLDPFTGRKTLTYKLAPEAGTEYLLYSFGRNGIDDNGTIDEKDPYKSDIVIRR